ncbi:unnamed protein product [Bursaphelenchus xylophilus]|uniref:(pine wood nematode) hypothetical protein n=1 Tax=Bursaphelenchus xylophilus TaxID=6326 RepID=A0A1I7RX61_BURXY|nr:unnamed protein product [Bursaphelenchus xylophilus]CAG9121349.1 unnamed protein product [Bursaphelenchus xylophilus]
MTPRPFKRKPELTAEPTAEYHRPPTVINFEESLSEEDKSVIRRIRPSALLRKFRFGRRAEEPDESESTSGTFVTARSTQPLTPRTVMSSRPVFHLPPCDFAQYVGREDPRAFVTFLRQFRRFANNHGFTPEERLARLPAYHAGDAAEVYESLPEAAKTDFTVLTHELSKQFAAGAKELTCRDKFQTRTLRQGESLHMYLADLRNLLELAYPAATTSEVTRQKLLRQQFVKGLHPKLKQALFFRDADQITDISELLKTAQDTAEHLTQIGEAKRGRN